MLVEVGIVGLLALATWQATKPGPGVMTPERRLVFTHALSKIDPPLTSEKLNELAEKFDGQGLSKHAEILRKRAVMRDRPEEVKRQYRAAFQKAMGSKDVLNIRALATAFESQGLTNNARKLREYAIGLDSAAGIPGVIEFPPPMETVAVVEPPGENALEAEFAGPSTVILAASAAKAVPPAPGSVPPPPPSTAAPATANGDNDVPNEVYIRSGVQANAPRADSTLADPSVPYADPDPSNLVQTTANRVASALDELSDDIASGDGIY